MLIALWWAMMGPSMREEVGMRSPHAPWTTIPTSMVTGWTLLTLGTTEVSICGFYQN